MRLHLLDETLKTKVNSIANTKLWNCVNPRETKLGSHNRQRHRHRRRHPRLPRPAHLIRLKSISPGAVDVAMRFNGGNRKGGRERVQERERKNKEGCTQNFMAGNYLPSAISIKQLCTVWWPLERRDAQLCQAFASKPLKGIPPPQQQRPSRVHFSTSVATFPIETCQRQREREGEKCLATFHKLFPIVVDVFRNEIEIPMPTWLGQA